MARSNRILIPEAREGLDQLKTRVMKEQGYMANDPDTIKYEVAEENGIPLTEGYNGKLTAEQAGKIGGPIGGNMVKEMIRMAQQQMANKQ
ncbi:small, acid-soluble spore protein, alpha/beta type [Chungangia koreensis]|uniref:Small, acid-soluble spore protein, alpha/beta type n=1 Tax=Chungangia koreensis TaxID=752657 RepID=A0ABV8X4Y6_9LACT